MRTASVMNCVMLFEKRQSVYTRKRDRMLWHQSFPTETIKCTKMRKRKPTGGGGGIENKIREKRAFFTKERKCRKLMKRK